MVPYTLSMYTTPDNTRAMLSENTWAQPTRSAHFSRAFT
jgi:hypothetical protein